MKTLLTVFASLSFVSISHAQLILDMSGEWDDYMDDSLSGPDISGNTIPISAITHDVDYSYEDPFGGGDVDLAGIINFSSVYRAQGGIVLRQSGDFISYNIDVIEISDDNPGTWRKDTRHQLGFASVDLGTVNLWNDTVSNTATFVIAPHGVSPLDNDDFYGYSNQEASFEANYLGISEMRKYNDRFGGGADVRLELLDAVLGRWRLSLDSPVASVTDFHYEFIDHSMVGKGLFPVVGSYLELDESLTNDDSDSRTDRGEEYFDFSNGEYQSTPEPSSVLLLGLGCGALLVRRSRS